MTARPVTACVQCRGVAMELPVKWFPLNPSGEVRYYPIRTNSTGVSVGEEKQPFFTLERGALPINTSVTEKDAGAGQAKLRKAAEGFEAIFVRQFLKTMNATVSGSGGMFGGGAAGEMYGDIAENALAETLAGQGRFGIADALYRQLSSRLGTTVSGDGAATHGNIPKAGAGK